MVAQCYRSDSQTMVHDEPWRQSVQWFNDSPTRPLLRVVPDAMAFDPASHIADDDLRDALTAYLDQKTHWSPMTTMVAPIGSANVPTMFRYAPYDVDSADIGVSLTDLQVAALEGVHTSEAGTGGVILSNADLVEISTTISDLLAKIRGASTAESTAIRIAGHLIPVELKAIAHEIDRSRYLLGDNWDGEETEAVDRRVWRQAVQFLASSATAYFEHTRSVVPACRIGGGPAGSIDLHWRLPDRELLLNIDADQPAVATFYGDDGTGSQQIKGSLDPAVPAEWLIAWLLGR